MAELRVEVYFGVIVKKDYKVWHAPPSRLNMLPVYFVRMMLNYSTLIVYLLLVAEQLYPNQAVFDLLQNLESKDMP